jgi:crotonobetainyl-CoA:carnitine CoA-transferase CaiB-like acyl-CoA transferase
MFFAELGASVIKVENPKTRGDVTRTWQLAGETVEDGMSSYFACANWGKKSVALDLTTAEGYESFLELLSNADVLLANPMPGDRDKLGIDPEKLLARFPKLIYGRISAYGPQTREGGYDAVIQAESGFMSMNGDAGSGPLKMPVALMDILAAHQLKEGLLVALWRRERSGRGGVVDVSLIQSAVASLANQATAWLNTGQVPQRLGSLHPSIAPYGETFQTSDGATIILAVGSDRQFRALCKILEIPEVAEKEEFSSNPSRVVHRAKLAEILARQIEKRACEEMMEAFQVAGVPAGRVRDVARVFERAEAAELVLKTDSTKLKGVRSVVFSISGSASEPVSAPPRLDEHRNILAGGSK